MTFFKDCRNIHTIYVGTEEWKRSETLTADTESNNQFVEQTNT